MRNLMIAMLTAGVLAAVIFQAGLDPRFAGLIAGSAFIAVGVFGVVVAWPRRRSGWAPMLALVLAVIHVIGIAVPMVAFRILNWSEPFSKVAVWGLGGAEFHALSTRFYGFWLVIVAVAWWMERKKDPGGSYSAEI